MGTPTLPSGGLRILFVRASGNAKLGPIPATYSGRQSCPTSCPLYRNGCYAEGIDNRNSSKPWARATHAGPNTVTIAQLVLLVRALPVRQLWRHNVAGDLPGTGDRIAARELVKLVKANRGRRGYTYTHKPVLSGPHAAANRRAILEANRAGFTVNLSADNLADADRKADLGIGPVVVILPKGTPDKVLTPSGRTVQVCPAVTGRVPDCASCGACAAAGRRAIIGFPVHGPGTRAADAIARGPALSR